MGGERTLTNIAPASAMEYALYCCKCVEGKSVTTKKEESHESKKCWRG